MTSLIRLTPQQAGAQLETLVEHVCAHYVATGQLGDWWREGTPAIKAGGEWIPQDGRPDFACILPGGRFVAFDAKSCQGNVYRHDTKTRGHQLRALWSAFEADAIAGLLVCNLEAGRGWWLRPRSEWAAGQFSQQNLTASSWNMSVPAHPDFEGGYAPDWLQVIR